MAINFPNSPTLNAIYSYNGRTWTWDGSAWTLVNVAQIGIITVTGGGGGESYWAQSTLGIHTRSNVGIATTNPTQVFQVGTGSSVIVIDRQGDLGIGTTNPSQPFQVGSGSSIIVIDGQGDLGIGTTNPSTKLQVQGDANISGVLTVSNGFVSGAPVTLTGQPFFRNQPFISTDYSIGTSFNEMSIGPITVNSGVTVTVESGAVWTIV